MTEPKKKQPHVYGKVTAIDYDGGIIVIGDKRYKMGSSGRFAIKGDGIIAGDGVWYAVNRTGQALSYLCHEKYYKAPAEDVPARTLAQEIRGEPRQQMTVGEMLDHDAAKEIELVSRMTERMRVEGKLTDQEATEIQAELREGIAKHGGSIPVIKVVSKVVVRVGINLGNYETLQMEVETPSADQSQETIVDYLMTLAPDHEPTQGAIRHYIRRVFGDAKVQKGEE